MKIVSKSGQAYLRKQDELEIESDKIIKDDVAGKFVKVRREGGSTVITVGELIPSDWNIAELHLRGTTASGTILLSVRRVS